MLLHLKIFSIKNAYTLINLIKQLKTVNKCKYLHTNVAINIYVGS